MFNEHGPIWITYTAFSAAYVAVTLVTFFVWFFSRRAEERRRKAIQQAIEERAAANASQPQVKRPTQVAASA